MKGNNEEYEAAAETEQDTNNESDDRVYGEYSGFWSYEGKTNEQILAEGGKEKEKADEGDTEVYPAYDPSWTEEEMIHAINARSQYYRASAYYLEITDYWENVRGVRDIANLIEPLFETDKRYYTKEDFENEPKFVIHLAKNEIYARHGYIFKNKDLYNYFMGCIWYSPTCESQDFKDSVFNEYEKANLELLVELDS